MFIPFSRCFSPNCLVVSTNCGDYETEDTYIFLFFFNFISIINLDQCLRLC